MNSCDIRKLKKQKNNPVSKPEAEILYLWKAMA